jgi:hypothetical protein
MLTKDQLIARLLVLSGAIAAAELELLEAETAKGHLQNHLTTVEDQLLLAGALDGKNAETRAAQLRAGTVACREQLDEAAHTLARRKISLHHLQTEHASLRAIARLLAAATE